MHAKFPPYAARRDVPVGAAEAAEYYREVAGNAGVEWRDGKWRYDGSDLGPCPQPAPPHDPVTKPAHYQRGGIETIDYIRATLGDEGFAAYCLGNVLKYVSRFREKDGVQDLKKAQVYLGWAISAQEQRPRRQRT